MNIVLKVQSRQRRTKLTARNRKRIKIAVSTVMPFSKRIFLNGIWKVNLDDEANNDDEANIEVAKEKKDESAKNSADEGNSVSENSDSVCFHNVKCRFPSIRAVLFKFTIQLLSRILHFKLNFKTYRSKFQPYLRHQKREL